MVRFGTCVFLDCASLHRGYTLFKSRDNICSSASYKADYVLEQIEKALNSLSENPQRGACPKELQAVGLREFREILFKPYRIICRVMEKKVYVLLIADGRRDMQSLLQRRLLWV